ncbi:hypothetical protein [Streptomyces sp. NPDC005525]|uniref:hypothetical protein n=1 Tax=Streptomyces sp. NPDC005525 TaxID=3364720 RepID=UPI0036A4A503
MKTVLLTIVNLSIAISSMGLGVVKALAVRHQRELALKLTAAVLISAGLIFLLATPFVYRFVGEVTHSSNICALLVPSATLVCVGHAHALSQLWQPDRRDPALLRRTFWRWAPVYGGAIAAMAVLYFHAPLGPATPLRFAAAYAHVPEVVALHVIYWVTLILTIVVTVRECRKLSFPGRPGLVENLKKCVGWFALALGLDLVNVLLTAASMIGSVAGPRRLDGLAQSAWLATIASCIAANVALAALVLRSRRTERQDIRTLQTLHNRVVKSDVAVRKNPNVVLAPRWSLWAGFDTSAELTSLMAELEDGFGRLSPWWSPLPSLTLDRLVQAHRSEGNDWEEDWDLAAARAAATLLYAADSRGGGLPPLPPPARLTRLPGSDIEPHAWRQHLVRVATYGVHPLVTDAVDLASKVQVAAGSHEMS